MREPEYTKLCIAGLGLLIAISNVDLDLRIDGSLSLVGELSSYFRSSGYFPFLVRPVLVHNGAI